MSCSVCEAIGLPSCGTRILSTWDLNSAALSTSAAAMLRFVVVLAKFESVAACRLKYSLPITIDVDLTIHRRQVICCFRRNCEKNNSGCRFSAACPTTLSLEANTGHAILL